MFALWNATSHFSWFILDLSLQKFYSNPPRIPVSCQADAQGLILQWVFGGSQPPLVMAHISLSILVLFAVSQNAVFIDMYFLVSIPVLCVFVLSFQQEWKPGKQGLFCILLSLLQCQEVTSHNRQRHELWRSSTWTQALTLPLTNSVTNENSLDLSESPS